MSELPFPIAKRISDRIRRTYEDCTAEKVQRVYAGHDLPDRALEVAIDRELDEYGFARPNPTKGGADG